MAENELKITDTFIEWKNKFNKSLNDVSVYGLRVEALDTLQTQHYNELKSADSDLTTKYNELNTKQEDLKTKQEDLTTKYNNLSANVDSKYKKAINACIAYALILGDNSTLKLPADFDLVQAYNYVNSLNNSDSSGSGDSGSGGTESGGSGTGSGSDSGTTNPDPNPDPPMPDPPLPEVPEPDI